MGAISIGNCDSLFWAGRYSERTFTTLHGYAGVSGDYDRLKKLGEGLGLDGFMSHPDLQTAFTGQGGLIEYCISMWHSNAVSVRHLIGTAAVSKAEMALGSVSQFDADFVLGCVYAFWGAADDFTVNTDVRDLLWAGKLAERLDLYARLDEPIGNISDQFMKLKTVISRSDVLKFVVSRFSLDRMEEGIIREEKDKFILSAPFLEVDDEFAQVRI